MVVLPNVLFIRQTRQEKAFKNYRKNQNEINSSNKRNLSDGSELRKGKEKKKSKERKNKTRSFYSKSKHKNYISSSLNHPKSLILQLKMLKNKTAQCFNRLIKIFPRREGSLHKCSQKSKVIESENYSDYYDNYYINRNVSMLDNFSLSDGSSMLEVWKKEWDTCFAACALRQSSIFEDIPNVGVKRNFERNINSLRRRSTDSALSKSEETISSLDYHSAFQSYTASLITLRGSNGELERTEEDHFYDCLNTGTLLNVFLEAGYKVKDLLELGCDIKDLKGSYCRVEDLLEAGCTIGSLIGAGYTVSDLMTGGCKEKDIFNYIKDDKLFVNSGISLQDKKEHKNCIEELLAPKLEKKLEIQRRLATGKDLYPSCDVSIWLRTCQQEILEPLSGITTGTIPPWLKGTLLRNGPGSLQVGNDSFQHLFDGSALIHRFGIQNGEVKYQCKFIETNTYKKNHAAQRIVVTEFGTAGVPDPCQSIFHRISVLFNPGETLSDNAMISVYPFGDKFYAFAENSVVHEVDPTTLASVERVNVSKHVNIVNHTSHPHVMGDGTVYNLGMSVHCTGPHYSIIKFPPPIYEDVKGMERKVKSPFEQAQIVASVPARWKFNPSYMHTFGITDHYYVIVEQPLSISFTTMLQRHLKNQPMAPSLKWHKNELTRILLIDRETGKLVTKFLADAFFYLHIINQYEEDNHLVLDISCYKDATMLDCMYINALKEANKNPDYAEMFRGRPLRFVLPLVPAVEGSWGTNLVKLSTSKAKAYRFMDNNVFVCPELICDLGCETPRINYEKYLGKRYQYFYAISSDVDLDNPGTLIKVDIINRTTKTWSEDNVFPSEPVFVPSPHSNSEDDGVVLSAMVWTQGMENKVGLLVLDAQTWTELGRTVFFTPSPVPKCLHGWFTNYS